MTKLKFVKTLSANDVGKTKSHQAGLLIPKSQPELIDALGPLDFSKLNPRRIVKCIDDLGVVFKFNFIYYNNKLFGQGGTRNEFRLTGMTKYLNRCGADEGDELTLISVKSYDFMKINISKPNIDNCNEPIRLSGWRVVH